MYTPRRTKLQFEIICEEDPVPRASAQQYHIYIIQIFIYIFLRESSRKMCSKTHQIAQLTINLGSMLQYTPKYSVRSNTLSITLIQKMNIYTIFFFTKF